MEGSFRSGEKVWLVLNFSKGDNILGKIEKRCVMTGKRTPTREDKPERKRKGLYKNPWVDLWLGGHVRAVMKFAGMLGAKKIAKKYGKMLGAETEEED